jgi:hypothetical protein
MSGRSIAGLLCTHAGWPEIKNFKVADRFVKAKERTAVSADGVNRLRSIPAIKVVRNGNLIQDPSAVCVRNPQCFSAKDSAAFWAFERLRPRPQSLEANQARHHHVRD